MLSRARSGSASQTPYAHERSLSHAPRLLQDRQRHLPEGRRAHPAGGVHPAGLRADGAGGALPRLLKPLCARHDLSSLRGDAGHAAGDVAGSGPRDGGDMSKATEWAQMAPDMRFEEMLPDDDKRPPF